MWNEFLPISMPITATGLLRVLRHGVLLVFGAPCQPQSLAGQEHGRTIPLCDINRFTSLRCTTMFAKRCAGVPHPTPVFLSRRRGKEGSFNASQKRPVCLSIQLGPHAWTPTHAVKFWPAFRDR